MLELGSILRDDYLITQRLGQGGMAVVFEARHTRLPVKYAIKVINAELREDAALVRRFRQEAEILCSLKNPNIITVHDWNFLPNGHPYLVMELLQGEDLAERLNHSGPLSAAVALKIFRQIVSALHYAHAHGVIHRDIKPANIFLHREDPQDTDGPESSDEHVKVVDFGIAKFINGMQLHSTTDSTLIGTPAYMSPEQAKSENAELDGRSDQYSMAILLYEMLSGYTPFWRPGDTPLSTMNRVAYADAPPLPAHIVQAIATPQRERIELALTRALAKSPKERWPSMNAFMAAIDGEPAAATPSSDRTRVRSSAENVARFAVVTTTTNTFVSQPTAAEAVARQPKRYATMGGGAFALGLIIAALGAFDHLRRGETQPTVLPRPVTKEVAPARHTSDSFAPAQPLARELAPAPGPLVDAPLPYRAASAVTTVPMVLRASSPRNNTLSRGEPNRGKLAAALPPALRGDGIRQWSITIRDAEVQQIAVIKPCLEPLKQIIPRDVGIARFTIKGNSSLMIEPHPAIPSRYRDRVVRCLEDAKPIVHLPNAAVVVMKVEPR